MASGCAYGKISVLFMISVRNPQFWEIEGVGTESSPWGKAIRNSIFSLHLTSKNE